jgi:hypothetical protein
MVICMWLLLLLLLLLVVDRVRWRVFRKQHGQQGTPVARRAAAGGWAGGAL